ncbi:hypothetical protein HMPREF9695_04410 [Afipia broomeae ATCC 49717]|uniref:Uncharacterized protein n=1 Tax=Afipia broomeae ATCC 49717 TaxID=883078 RepID=K8P491_9BRAD|nr:hypothetical protein HMPREF9695_04410 [Afipia broomeae ATCC 49717]
MTGPGARGRKRSEQRRGGDVRGSLDRRSRTTLEGRSGRDVSGVAPLGGQAEQMTIWRRLQHVIAEIGTDTFGNACVRGSSRKPSWIPSPSSGRSSQARTMRSCESRDSGWRTSTTTERTRPLSPAFSIPVRAAMARRSCSAPFALSIASGSRGSAPLRPTFCASSTPRGCRFSIRRSSRFQRSAGAGVELGGQRQSIARFAERLKAARPSPDRSYLAARLLPPLPSLEAHRRDS